LLTIFKVNRGGKIEKMIQRYMLEFYSDLQQVGGFLWLPPPIKTEILLKVALNTITLTLRLLKSSLLST
jgi:hypothetical protein